MIFSNILIWPMNSSWFIEEREREVASSFKETPLIQIIDWSSQSNYQKSYSLHLASSPPAQCSNPAAVKDWSDSTGTALDIQQ